MAEENEKQESDVLKAIHDKLTELEDLQLVNKLDIINVKNELDRTSLTGGASHETNEQSEELAEKSENLQKAEKLVKELEELKSAFKKGKLPDAGKSSVNLDAVTGEIEALKEKVGGLEKRRGVTPSGKIPDASLDEMRKRIDRLESAKPSESKTAMPADLRDDVAEIKEKISGLEKLPKMEGTPANVLEKISEIEEISSDIESLRSQLDEQKTLLSSLEKRKPSAGAVPNDLEEKINRMEEEISGLEKDKTASQPGVPHDISDRIKMLEAAVADETGRPHVVEAKPAKALLDRISRLEDKISALDGSKGKAGETTVAGNASPDGIEEVKNMLENIKASLMDQGNEIADLKSVKKGTQNLIDMDAMKGELDSIKSQISVIEENAVKSGMAPDALEELRNLKGQFPIEEYHDLKKRMTAIEGELEELGKLAGGLKPIELPKEGDSGMGPSKALENKVREIEKLVGEGVSGKRFKDLEKRQEEMREWLPEYIANDIDHRIDEFRTELKNKVQEVNELKEDMIEQTIEQLLAQPGHVSKLLGEKFKKQLDEMQQKLSKMENDVKPSGAKLTTLLRDFDESKRDIEKEKEALKGMQENNRKEMESLAIELRALNTRIDSFDKSGKGTENVGVTRDMEILKTKTDWLESTIHKLDLNQIYQKIDELEQMMHSHRGYSPQVIE